MARPGPSRTRDEQGVVAIVVALLMVTVLTGFASFALDIGYKRMASRDMQAVADIVAMDMARELNGSTTGVLLGSGNWSTRLAASLANQQGALGDVLTVKTCDAAAVQAKRAALSVIGICAFPGILNANGTFSSSGSAPATHVKVMTRTSVNYLLPVFAQKGDTARSAVASAETMACFMLGSYAARVNAGDSSLLGPLLGAIDSDLNLSLVSYQGLAGANVQLGALAADLGLGTVNDLATTQVTLGRFYLAMAHVLRNGGSAAQADLLESLSAKVGSLALKVGDLIDLTTAGSSALDASFNALDLVTASAQVANGDYGVSVSQLGINIPGLSSLNGNLHVTEQPKWKCGDSVTGTAASAAAHSTQVDLGLHGTLVSLPSIGGALASTTGLDLNLAVASARGWLRNVRCGPATLSDPEGITVDVATGLADASIGVPIHIAGDLSLAGLVGVYRVDLNLLASTSLTSSDNTQSVEYKVPPQTYGQPKSTVNNALPMPAVTVALDPSKTQSVKLLTSVLGIPLPGVELGPVLTVVNPVISAVTSQIVTPIITPVVSSVNNLLLNQLAPALGLKLGGADLYLMPHPNCATPALRG
jgi:uncharacterized membrane protein